MNLRILAAFLGVMALTALATPAQTLETFKVTTDTHTNLILTRDLPPALFGDYLKQEGPCQWRYHFQKTGVTYFWERSCSAGDFQWDPSQKITLMDWGVLVENGKIVQREEKTWRAGKEVTLQTMLLFSRRLGRCCTDKVFIEPDGTYSINQAYKLVTSPPPPNQTPSVPQEISSVIGVKPQPRSPWLSGR